jgi:glutamate racemase
MTVVRAMARLLPQESIYYFGDTIRCPYGPRPLEQVRRFALQIGHWLDQQQIKLLVIACNTATAAALTELQQELDIPVLGVIMPGARAATQATQNRRVAVIGTKATIESGLYAESIRTLDAGITVFSTATPLFVEIAESGLKLDRNPVETFMSRLTSVYTRPALQEIARDYLDPLKRCQVDTLVLGCTHYPLLRPLIETIMGPRVAIISSADEVAADVAGLLRRRELFNDGSAPATRQFATTAVDLPEFMHLATAILGHVVDRVRQVDLTELGA